MCFWQCSPRHKPKCRTDCMRVCLMANQLHLLLRPDDASQLPRLMHWVGWYSAMALNRLAGRCGHFWEARYYATAIAPKDHRRVLNTLRYINANPKAAGVRKGFYDPYSNYGHYGRLECDGISEWHPSFLTLAPTLKGCSKRYERFCQQYGIAITAKGHLSVTGAQGC